LTRKTKGPWHAFFNLFEHRNPSLLNVQTMRPVNITADDSIAFNDLQAGNSAQVRVVVYGEEQQELKKGNIVQMVFNEDQLSGKIVSDPLLIDDKREDGGKIVSLIVEKV
jgi:hypothetical protein